MEEKTKLHIRFFKEKDRQECGYISKGPRINLAEHSGVTINKALDIAMKKPKSVYVGVFSHNEEHGIYISKNAVQGALECEIERISRRGKIERRRIGTSAMRKWFNKYKIKCGMYTMYEYDDDKWVSIDILGEN